MTSKRVAIVQSNYIPWKGYFDLINMVDEFILFEDAQYTRNDWRNRNRIKSANGPIWLTIPVQISGRFGQRIRDAQVSNSMWATKHWKSILASYSRAPHFHLYRNTFETLYVQMSEETYLSEINEGFIRAICRMLNIQTRISRTSNYELLNGKTERLISLCQQAGATAYISGPAAQVYLDEPQFAAAGIALSYMNYDDYPTYNQLYPPFEQSVSVIDLLFNQGPEAGKYMKTFTPQ
ncbi:MAG: WbqC family protein [Burkholderiales bacterium]|nr:WbqC family protein [Anaerolineae bacterium]